jgi:Na+/proline symporter
MLAGLPPALPIVGVAVATLIYTTWGGLRASILTDRWQAWLLLALLVVVGGAAWQAAPQVPPDRAWPSAPPSIGLSVALTLVIAVTAANLFHQGYWQRVWAARDMRALNAGALLGGLSTVAVVALVGGLGMLAAASGADLGQPPAPFFALLRGAAPWLVVATLVLAVALVASSVDTLQNGIASLLVGAGASASLRGARWITVLLMVPVVAVALQGLSVLRLFLIADLLCATAVVPVLLGLWGRASPASAIAGSLAGLVGAVLPGWVAHGSLAAGLLAASFPSSVPTLGPFLGALLCSAVVSVGVALLRPRREPGAPAAAA